MSISIFSTGMELPHPPFFNFLFTFLFSIKALYYFISLFNMLMSVYPYNLMVTTACMSLVLALDYYYPYRKLKKGGWGNSMPVLNIEIDIPQDITDNYRIV
jgi:hypothetical protein